MKLIRAEGSFPMQQALTHSHVKTIVDIVLQHRETLGIVADVLQTYIKPKEPSLEKKLVGIRNLYSKFDKEGNSVVPAHIVSLTETLHKLYQQNFEKVKYQRGAVVELFARKLVCQRYDNDQECSNSRAFVDDRNRRITIQEVDVASLSTTRLHIEGYECKIKAQLLDSSDCIDLANLVIATRESGYRVNVGIVSFDSDKIVLRRLDNLRAVITHLPAPVLNSIQVYGLDRIEKLQKSPF